MSNLIKEFKGFALKGNLVQLAVAFVLGAAFAAVVAALVDQIVMPIVGIIFGEPEFENALVLTINESNIKFGAFLQAVVIFLMTAFALFVFVVKPYNAMQARVDKGEEEAPATPEDIELLREIRDSLAK
jgi:large conductance mechanosensitive channel